MKSKDGKVELTSPHNIHDPSPEPQKTIGEILANLTFIASIASDKVNTDEITKEEGVERVYNEINQAFQAINALVLDVIGEDENWKHYLAVQHDAKGAHDMRVRNRIKIIQRGRWNKYKGGAK